MMGILQKHKSFETVQVKGENIISLPGLTIYPNQRKMYRNRQEIPLTTKEYELLCLLVANHGQVLTYTQIYEKIIRYHLCNLRKKLNAISPDEPFIIRCIRDVGYCFEVKSK